MDQPRKPKGAPGGAGGQYDIAPADTGLLPPLPPDLGYRSMTGRVAGQDFTRTRLDRARWERVDAHGGRFRETIMVGARMFACDLTGADLTGARADATVLFDCRLDGADLTRARLRGSDIRRTTMTGVRAPGVRLGKASLTDTQLLGADLKGADLTDATLDGVLLGDADLTGADLKGATLDHTDMTATRLRDTVFDHARLTDTAIDPDGADGARFRHVRVDRCDCSARALDQAQWRDVTAHDSDFHGRRLAGLDGENRFVGCDLRGADLTQARVATLTGCDLRGARLDGIDPLDCDFNNAVVTPEQAERYGLASRGVVIVR